MRTLSSRERRYNPMSYHNGSVWPHDNAMAAWGLATADRTDGAVKIMTGLFHAAAGLNNESLPELFCGFSREPSLGPVPYPVACHPQAWSAASVFLLIQSILGIEVRGFEHRIVMRSPIIPEWLDWIRFDDLRVGNIFDLVRRSPGPPWRLDRGARKAWPGHVGSSQVTFRHAERSSSVFRKNRNAGSQSRCVLITTECPLFFTVRHGGGGNGVARLSSTTEGVAVSPDDSGAARRTAAKFRLRQHPY